jgi:hypothetical protein
MPRGPRYDAPGAIFHVMNRGIARRRDGALQRSRFISKPVSSKVYLRNVAPYVDENPVQAGLVARPEDHRWSSAGGPRSGPTPSVALR